MRAREWVLLSNAIEQGLLGACYNDLPEGTELSDSARDAFVDRALNRIQCNISESFIFDDED